MNYKQLFRLPFDVVKRITSHIIKEINEYRYPYKKRYKKLIANYKLCGLDQNREIYLSYLNSLLKELGFPLYDESNGMYSEHLIIFAAIATSNFKIKNILEIGTYDAKTSMILASLFPESIIRTIDLENDNPLFLQTYDRNENVDKFIRLRDKIIKKKNNIKFIQSNSLRITLMEQLPKQDLIWVDGAHGYPVVTSDITNCISLMHENTILMCDDIWKKSRNNDPIYKSNAGFQTLEAFSKARVIKNIYLRKRIGKKFNGNYKFISFSRLKNNQK